MRSIGIITLLIILTGVSFSAQAETTTWYDYEEGILAAGTSNKPVILDFYADWCPPCVAMEQGTYPDPRVVAELADFIAIKVDTQKRIDIETKYGIEYYPTVVFLNSGGSEISRHVGYLGPEDMVELIKQTRGRPPKEVPVSGSIPVLIIFILFLLKYRNIKFFNIFHGRFNK